MLEERDFSHSGLDPKSLIGKPVTSEHYTEVIENSSYINLDNDKPVVYLNLHETRFDEIIPHLENIVISKSSRKKLGDNNFSILFGAVTAKDNRSSRCNIGSLINKNPELNSMLTGAYSTIADNLMQQYLPQWHKVGHALFRKSGIHKSWQMAKTFFTSAVINKNSAHHFHCDDANCRNSYSAMFTMKNNMSGGYLVFPQYKIAIAVSNRSLIFFCGKEIIHGVSPLTIYEGGSRYSVVFYTTHDMQFCKSHKEETAI